MPLPRSLDGEPLLALTGVLAIVASVNDTSGHTQTVVTMLTAVAEQVVHHGMMAAAGLITLGFAALMRRRRTATN
jgi:uncharacterized protein (TIGR03382 family)